MMEEYPKREEPLSEALLDMVTGGSGRGKTNKESGLKYDERAYTERARQQEERLRQLGEQRKENWANMYRDVFKGWQGVKRDDGSSSSGKK